MFDLDLVNDADGRPMWRIVAREGLAGRSILIEDTDTGPEACLKAVRMAYNMGRREEAAVRVAALNGLLNPSPLAPR